MTANELRKHFADTYGLGPYPKTFEVDKETFANCCLAVFANAFDIQTIRIQGEISYVAIAFGEHNSLLFKGVELIVK